MAALVLVHLADPLLLFWLLLSFCSEIHLIFVELIVTRLYLL